MLEAKERVWPFPVFCSACVPVSVAVLVCLFLLQCLCACFCDVSSYLVSVVHLSCMACLKMLCWQHATREVVPARVLFI